jgi:hypothetical protein
MICGKIESVQIFRLSDRLTPGSERNGQQRQKAHDSASITNHQGLPQLLFDVHRDSGDFTAIS